MNHCPLCGNQAKIDMPEWSGGRYGVSCAECGDYSTNRIVIDEIERLRAEGNPRIEELKYTISIAEHSWYLNWSESLQMIHFEGGPLRELSKWDKKHRGKAIRAENATPINTGPNLFFDGGADDKGSD